MKNLTKNEFYNELHPMGFEPGLPGHLNFNKYSNLEISKMLITFFPPISTHQMQLILVVIASADAVYMVQLMSHDELNEFLSPENSPFYIVKLNI